MSINDLLFEPLNLPKPIPNASTGSNGIIIVPDDYVRVDIQRSHPVSLYQGVAAQLIDHAVAQHQDGIDIRKSTHPLPAGHLTMIDLVGRFHQGHKSIWIARPKVMPPRMFEFEGRFGYFKFFRMPDDLMASQSIFWFWLDSNEGQLAAIDLGILCVTPKFKMYHAFVHKTEADDYFRS